MYKYKLLSLDCNIKINYNNALRDEFNKFIVLKINIIIFLHYIHTFF